MANPESSSSSANLTADAVSYLNLLLNTIESQDWVTFNEIAIQNPIAFQSISNIINCTDEFNGMSFLHAIVRNHPPLEIAIHTIRICPDIPRVCDCLNRTPLHVAAGVGASAQVIQYLCIAHPDACEIQDNDGKTPLHIACDVECKLFQDQLDRHEPPTFEVVHALLSASIMPATVEDVDEITPLEYAICSNADVQVVKLLQKASQKVMKKKHAEEKQHVYERRSKGQLDRNIRMRGSRLGSDMIVENEFAYM